jgi:hypothetical protein
MDFETVSNSVEMWHSLVNQGCPMLTNDFRFSSSQDLLDLETAEAGRHKSNERLLLFNKLMKVDSDEIHVFQFRDQLFCISELNLMLSLADMTAQLLLLSVWRYWRQAIKNHNNYISWFVKYKFSSFQTAFNVIILDFNDSYAFTFCHMSKHFNNCVS